MPSGMQVNPGEKTGMSDVCGIFYKSCPQCAGTVAKSAAVCGCGYSFEDETPTSALAQSLAEEKLYEDYLLARVTQTAQAAIDAQAAQKRRPTDEALNAAALGAMKTAEAARRDLAAQGARVEELRRALAAEATIKPATSAEPESTPVPTAVNEAARAPEAPEPVSPRAAEVARAAEALRSELAKLRHEDVRHDNKRALTPARLLRPTRSEGGAENCPREATQCPRTDIAGEGAGDIVADISSEVVSTDTRVRADVAPAPAVARANSSANKRCPQCDAVTLVAANRCRCGFAFVTQAPRPSPLNVPKIEDVLARAQELKQARRESAQAQKAARIREARLARAAQKSVVPTPTPDAAASSPIPSTIEDAVRKQNVSAKPADTSAPRVPADRKEKPLHPVAGRLAPARPLATAVARDVKECSNCTANVAAHASHCKCGFEFRDVAAHTPMPALRLDDAELLKVRDLYLRR